MRKFVDVLGRPLSATSLSGLPRALRPAVASTPGRAEAVGVERMIAALLLMGRCARLRAGVPDRHGQARDRKDEEDRIRHSHLEVLILLVSWEEGGKPEMRQRRSR